ncbi:arginase [Paenibacillus sp. Marseille-Q4541]|uniref:arginase n=1 Tax=Paenibacillus sp. Marseille-Q4541 TaxID=2831522 RepID=UPI001BABB467|nr:arginase [Paenibacillus sp. Marseille-Q4541]
MANSKIPVSILTVPFDLGASQRGTKQGPKAILDAGLVNKLNALHIHHTVNELQIPPSMQEKTDFPKLKNLNENMSVHSKLADEVYHLTTNGGFPLILGGDHSIAIGTVSGLRKQHSNLGIIWMDAHSDLNTPDTTPSGNIHGMSLAVSLGMGDPRLTSIGGKKSTINPKNVVIVGARSLDQGERDLIRKEGITCYTMHDIDRLGMARVMEEAIRISSSGTDGVHLSFDIDSIEPQIAPGTGTPVPGGLSYREAHLAMEMLHESNILTSAEMVENNPLFDEDNKSSHLIVGLIGSLLGERIL